MLHFGAPEHQGVIVEIVLEKRCANNSVIK